jgi:hypothetical protein
MIRLIYFQKKLGEIMLSTSESPFVTVSQSLWTGQDETLKKEISEAAKRGFFYLEMPDDCRPLVKEVKDFASWVFSMRNLNSTNYHDGGGNIQREQAYFHEEEWSTLFPEKVLELTQKISSINIEILKNIYSWAGFSECDYEKISGGATSGKGTSVLNFSHYRAEKKQKGLGEHRDFGQITLLFIDKVGLQVHFHGNWVDVKPMENHFVIIFGQTLEVLIHDKSQLIAANHRVAQVFEDRISITLFTHNRSDTPIQQRIDDEIKVYRNTSYEFLQECLENTQAFK